MRVSTLKCHLLLVLPCIQRRCGRSEFSELSLKSWLIKISHLESRQSRALLCFRTLRELYLLSVHQCWVQCIPRCLSLGDNNTKFLLFVTINIMLFWGGWGSNFDALLFESGFYLRCNWRFFLSLCWVVIVDDISILCGGGVRLFGELEIARPCNLLKGICGLKFRSRRFSPRTLVEVVAAAIVCLAKKCSLVFEWKSDAVRFFAHL